LLDAGAAAHGHVAGRAVSATAAPALVNTPSLAQWLVWTMDADLYDADMLAAAGQLGHDPARLFAYVRGLGYEAYDGSLRGTRGTLWSAAANSADQASLLIAMLRASGIPARYRHGALSPANAQTLIASMFPAPTRLVGRLDPALQTADPVNDPDLIAQVQDHWWVEAFLPGSGWTNLDPSFPTAAIGDAFATPASDGTDRIAELPDAVRHKVTIRVKVEAYHPLNLGQSGLDVSYPLDHTFRSVELTTAPVAVAHFVESESQGGLVFANTIHTYTPYLLLGETQIVGQPYQDLLTNFPLGTTFHTAVWIEFDLTTPAGDTSSYVREVVDRIGYEARVNGGNSSLALAGDGSQLVTDFDVYATGFWPHVVPTSAVERAKADTLAQVGRMQADGERLAELAALPSLTPAELTEAAQLRGQVQYDLAAYLGSLALAFADSADQVLAATAPASLVRAYYATPRLITAGVEPGAADTTFTIDLRHTAARVLPYPGQPAEAAVSFNVVKGILESGLEGATLDSATGQTSLTTAGLFSAASDQGIASVTITPDNLDLLDELNISAVARARITTAAAAHGKLVIVPAAPVLIAGTAQFGWWEIDIASGETIGLLDNGLHNAIIEFTVGMIIGAISGPFVDFMIGIGAYALGFAASNATKVLGGPVLDLGAYKDHVSSASTTLSCALPWTGAYGAGGCAGLYDYFGLGMKAAEGLLSNIQGADPPISSFPLGVITPPTPPSIVSGTLAVAPTLPAGTLNASLTTDFTAVSGTLAASHASPGAAYRYDSLTLASGTLKDAAGATIGSGAIAAAGPGLLTATAADVTLSGAGQMGFYAAPLPAIGSASYFDAAQVTLSGSSLVLTLPDTAVSLDGVTYSGRFTVEANA
ncbi:MAG: transglutaminase domain-containing protein, partial [Anaerolineales bacterium]|nr:transglutaminase domain-containing protein [Anaerolineales bacterium]